MVKIPNSLAPAGGWLQAPFTATDIARLALIAGTPLSEKPDYQLAAESINSFIQLDPPT